METYIAMALLILPGFLFKIIIKELTDSPFKKSTFENTVVSLIWSIPILILNTCWLEFRWKIITYGQLVDQFKSLSFIMYYAILSLCSCIAMLLVKYMVFIVIKKIRNKISNKKDSEYSSKLIKALKNVIENGLINTLRIALGYEMKSGKENPWQDFFNTKEIMAIEIFVDKEKVGGGFVKNWDLEGIDSKDIILEQCNDFEKYKEKYKNKKNEEVPIESIYIDPIKKLVIKEYLFDVTVLD